MLLSSCVKSPSDIMVVIQDFILASYFVGGFYNILKEHTFLYLSVTTVIVLLLPSSLNAWSKVNALLNFFTMVGVAKES